MTKSKNLKWMKLSTALAISFGLFIISLTLTTIAAEPDDFSYPYNLSNAAADGRDAGTPKLVSKENTLAVVWSEGYNSQLNTKSNGSIFLNSADETAGYWRQKISVFDASATLWGNDPAVIFDNTEQVVHIVWTEADATNTNNLHYHAIKYARCDVSTDYNTCTSPQTVASANTNSDFRNPTIAQDDSGNLHVVWTDEAQAKVYYSLGTNPTQPNGASWHSATQIIASQSNTSENTGKTPQLAFQDGRLHLVWANNLLNKIVYFYDEIYTDNTFDTTHSFEWESDGDSTFPNGQVGHPTMVADGGYIFIAFDIQDPDAPNTDFYLVHARSTTNGTGWASTYKGIPDAGTPNSDIFKSNNANITGGLQPSLILTHTNGITHLNIAWHYLVGDSEEERYHAFHTWVNVDPNDTFNPVWNTPAVTITNPTGTSIGDAVAAKIAVSESGKLHAVYLARENTKWDAFYRGFIAGTIDPEYISTDMTVRKIVTPSLIFTTANTIDATTLKYTIAITNAGDLEAIGLHITDTLPSEIASVSLIEKTMGTTGAFNPTDKTITWTGDIPAHQTALITITALTENDVPVGQTLTNQADVWSDGDPGEIAATATANTYLFKPDSAFRLDKTVSPRHIVTTATTLPATDLNYSIRLSNLTNVAATNLKITDAFSETWWWYISPNEPDPQCSFGNCGTVVMGGDDYDILIWTGDLPAGESVSINFTAHTSAVNGEPVHPITNTVSLVNPMNGDILLTDSAVTLIGPMRIYLPLVIK